MKARIKQWIRRKKEAREMDDLQGMEAYRLSVILVSQLKVRHSDFRFTIYSFRLPLTLTGF